MDESVAQGNRRVGLRASLVTVGVEGQRGAGRHRLDHDLRAGHSNTFNELVDVPLVGDSQSEEALAGRVTPGRTMTSPIGSSTRPPV